MSTQAIIYVRISQDREGAGLGVERQESDCRELAERLGWTVVDVLCDNDVSAYSGKPRPAYRKLLEALRTGSANGVLVWHTDRLHRSPVELEDYVQVCETHGIATQTAKAGPLDLASPSGRLVARQLGAVARYEIEHNVERLRAARLQSVKAGKWAGGRRPFGYEPDGVTVRESEAAEVRTATEQVVAGGSIRSICANLNDRNVRTSADGEWRQSEVRKLLIRPRNAGLMVHHGEVVGDAEWPAIVDVDLWRACRAILTDPGRRTNMGGPRHHFGSGLYVCGVCGEGLRVSSNGKRRKYYTCVVGNHVARDLNDLDDYITNIVVERLRAPDAVEAMRPPTKDTTGLHVEAEGLRERLKELARMYADGQVSGAQLAEATEGLRSRLDTVESKIANAVESSTLTPFVGRDPAEVWDELDVDRRRAVLDLLVRVVIHRARKGRPPGWKPGESYFDPTTIDVEWKGAP